MVVKREIFLGIEKLAASFCKNVKCGSFVLAFHYVSCFNASLSRYVYYNVSLFCI